MEKTSRSKLEKAIELWIRQLDQLSGWRERKRHQFLWTIFSDDVPYASNSSPPKEYSLPAETDLQHSIIMHYLSLAAAIEALKECEWYFRRFPFRKQEVTMFSHFSNTCEMYFSHFYSIRERLKNYLTLLSNSKYGASISAGPTIREFDKQFQPEIRERHQVHHSRQFEDVVVDRVLLLSLLASSPGSTGGKQELRNAYRKATRKWARRVRNRAVLVNAFVEHAAAVTLETCKFLTQARSQQER
jgi:hypothetical protein